MKKNSTLSGVSIVDINQLSFNLNEDKVRSKTHP